MAPSIPLLGSLRHVLVACSHPDDESFGLGAVIGHLVDQGTRVDLLCFTGGEASTLGAGDDLAQRRLVELRAAARVLGIGGVRVLGFADGGLQDQPVGLLAAELEPMVGQVDALLTFDTTGVTGHPDHVRIAEATIAAASRWDIPALGWGVTGPVAGALNAEFGAEFAALFPVGGDVVIVVDRDRQRRAMECHSSQLTDNPVPGRRIALQGDLEALRWLAVPDDRSSWSPHASVASTACAAPGLLDELVDCCRTGHPAEVCGLIGGSPPDLESMIAVDNVAEQRPDRCGFHMDPTGQFRAIRSFEDSGREVTGIFHSHPRTSPVPSVDDVRLSSYPEAVHLIVSTKDRDRPELGAWRIVGDVAYRIDVTEGDPRPDSR